MSNSRILLMVCLLLCGGWRTACGQTTDPIVIDEADARFQGVHCRFWMGNLSYDDSLLATAAGWDGEPGELVLWDLEQLKPKVIRRQNPGIRTVVFSPDGEFLATSDFAENLSLVDQKTGVLKALPKQASTANSLVFTPDSKSLLCGCSNGCINLVDLQAGTSQKILETPGERVVTIALSTNGNRLVAVTWQGRAHVWDFPSRQLLHKLDVVEPENVGRTPAEGLAFAPDEATFVTGTFGRTLRIWNANTGEMLHDLKGNKTGQLAAAYSPDGNLLATVGNQGDLNYWNPQTGELIQTVQAHSVQCSSVAFTSNGDRVITTSWDRTVKIWNVETKELITTLSRAAMEN